MRVPHIQLRHERAIVCSLEYKYKKTFLMSVFRARKINLGYGQLPVALSMLDITTSLPLRRDY